MSGIIKKSIRKLSSVRRKSVHSNSSKNINKYMNKLVIFVKRYLKVKKNRIDYVKSMKDQISNYYDEIIDAYFNFNFVNRIYHNCSSYNTLDIALNEANEYLEYYQDYLQYIILYEDPLETTLHIDKEIEFSNNNILTCYKIIDLIIECQKEIKIDL
jgi:hypothetical protein